MTNAAADDVSDIERNRLRVGWFSTGRGEGSQKLLRAAVEAIQAGELRADIAFVFSNRTRGAYEETDRFFDQVVAYGIPLVTLSDKDFRKQAGGAIARTGMELPPWRQEYDGAVADLLRPFEYDVGMLAGYMLIMTAPLFTARPMLNLHPAAPGQPEGTWQDVTWKLIEQGTEHGGVRIHRATAGLDEGPIVTYCTYPLRGDGIDAMWAAVAGQDLAVLRERHGEELPLFQEMRRRGAAREAPLVVATLRALADGTMQVKHEEIWSDRGAVSGGHDLTDEIERRVGDGVGA